MTMGTHKRPLLAKVLNHLLKSKMSAKSQAQKVFMWVSKYCDLCEDYAPMEMQRFVDELELINGGPFENNGTGMIVTLTLVRDWLNEDIPKLLRLLERNMPDNLVRFNSMEWRSLFGIGIQISTETCEPDDSPPSASR